MQEVNAEVGGHCADRTELAHDGDVESHIDEGHQGGTRHRGPRAQVALRDVEMQGRGAIPHALDGRAELHHLGKLFNCESLDGLDVHKDEKLQHNFDWKPSPVRLVHPPEPPVRTMDVDRLGWTSLMTPRRNLIRWLAVFAAMLIIPSFGGRAEAANLSAALTYVPADAMAVGTVDVSKLQRLPLYKKLQQRFYAEEPEAKKEVDELRQATGFDPFRDIRGLVVALGPDFEQDDDQFVVIAEAKVNEQRMIAYMKKKGATPQLRNDAQIGRWYEIAGGDAALAFRGPHVIFGGVKTFKAAMAKKGASPKIKALLSPYLVKDLGFAALVPSKMKKDARREMAELGDIETVRGGGSLQNGLDLELLAGFNSATSASRLATIANQFLDRARQSPEISSTGLGKYANKLQLNAIGKDIKASIKLTRTEVDELVKLVETLL